MTKATACLFGLLCCVLSAAEEQWVVSLNGRDVAIHLWRGGAATATGVLVLVPGTLPTHALGMGNAQAHESAWVGRITGRVEVFHFDGAGRAGARFRDDYAADEWGEWGPIDAAGEVWP